MPLQCACSLSLSSSRPTFRYLSTTETSATDHVGHAAGEPKCQRLKGSSDVDPTHCLIVSSFSHLHEGPSGIPYVGSIRQLQQSPRGLLLSKISCGCVNMLALLRRLLPVLCIRYARMSWMMPPDEGLTCGRKEVSDRLRAYQSHELRVLGSDHSIRSVDGGKT